MDSISLIRNQMRAFRILGMLPEKNSSFLYSLLGLTSFFVAGIGFITCQGISILYVQTTNDLIKELLLFSTTVIVTIKIVLFHLRRQHLLNILYIINLADKRIENHEDSNTMNNVYKFCRRITIIYSSFYIGSIGTLFFELIFLDKPERTWKSTALIPNDFIQQSNIFYSILVFQAIANTLNCFVSWTLETTSFSIISILCGHIEVFSLHLKQFGNIKNESTMHINRLKLLEYLNYYNLLNECVFYLKNKNYE